MDVLDEEHEGQIVDGRGLEAELAVELGGGSVVRMDDGQSDAGAVSDLEDLSTKCSSRLTPTSVLDAPGGPDGTLVTSGRRPLAATGSEGT